MTTIVVVRKNGEAVIGADTLGTYGDQRESATYIKNASKLIQVGDTWLAVTGHAALDMILRGVFAGKKSRGAPRYGFHSIDEILHTGLSLHRLLKEDYFLNTDEDDDDSFESSRMNVLIANPSGIFGLCARRTVFEYTQFYAFGSGEQYALGAMHARYDSNASAEAIARAGLEAAVSFDTGTGAPLEIQKIKLKTRKSAR